MSQREGRTLREEGTLTLSLLGSAAGIEGRGSSLHTSQSALLRVSAASPGIDVGGGGRPQTSSGSRLGLDPHTASSLLRPISADPYQAADPPRDAKTPYQRMCLVLPALHFMVGVSNALPSTAWQEYQVNGPHPLSPANQTLIGNVINQVPWNLKIFFAFLSDVAPIFGRRRIPYLVIGCVLKGASWFSLSVFYDTIPLGALCLQQFSLWIGTMITGTMCDTLIVENVKYETEEIRGRLQSRCYFMLSLGCMVGGPVGGWLLQYAGLSVKSTFLWMGLGMVTFLVPIAFAIDPRVQRVGSSGQAIKHTFAGVWGAAKLVRVLKPLIFILVFAMMPGSGTPFNCYLIQQNPICRYDVQQGECHSVVHSDTGTLLYDSWCQTFSSQPHRCNTRWGGLSFTPSQFSYMGMFGNLGSVVGNFVFGMWLIRAQWHCMFATIAVLCAGVTSLELLLFFRNDAGKTLAEQWYLPNYPFALGDDVVMSAANQLLTLPILILMAKLVPEGAEGTTFALVTSVQCVGGTVGGVFSKTAVQAFDIPIYDFSNLWKLVLFCSLIKLVSLFFLPLVPRNISDDADVRQSAWCGYTIGGLFVGGLLYTTYGIISALLEQ